ncbi:kinesin heavy chain-like isoform X2 [Zingiber officinale]|uniref:kinesin heavy chain-like isoform X2 n=1 Tax=Zingiber officinale TaxID=94328 RepID=UPI001C4D1D33|nr:kinesin heavy chain-like isoform X2 [Zingiber officinale]XP_042440854.1 kinesin heavy chain-like isoform X2 [Zingiber officinale]
MDAKKKKNRRKKENQHKVSDDAMPDSEKVAVQNGSGVEESRNIDTSTNVDVQSVGISESEMEHDKHRILEEKFAKVQEQFRHLETERTLWLQRQVNLEENVKSLKVEFDSYVQKEAILEQKLQHFESENDTLKHAEERIVGVEEDSIVLDMQVKGLERSRYILLEENQQLRQNIAALEQKIQFLEAKSTSHETLTEKMTKLLEGAIPVHESLSAFVRDQVSTSAEISSKVDEHYLVSEKHDEHASTAELNHTETQVRSSSPSHLLETDGKITESVVPEEEFVANGAVNLDSETVGQPGVQPLLVEPRISEVGTVIFDEIQIYEDNKREMIINDDPVPHEEVPFTDAPLIGAPFRLISFMAKYVSGADLAKRRDDS